MNKFEMSLSALRVPVDFFAIILAGYLSYYLRLSDTVIDLRPVLYEFSIQWYLWFVVGFALLTVILVAISGLYAMQITRGIVEEFTTLVNSVSTATLIIILYYYFYSRDVFSSRFLIISLWALSIILLMIGRILIRSLQQYLMTHYQLGVHRVALIMGGEVTGLHLAETLQQKPELGYKVVDQSTQFDERRLLELQETNSIDEVIVSDPHIDMLSLQIINDFCDEHKIDFQYVPNLFDVYTKIEVKQVDGLLLFRVKRTSLEGWGSISKRIFDIIFSLTMIILLSPLYIITSILIKLDSAGPLIYKSLRIGTKGKPFYVYKFRSMYQELCTDENDPQSIAREQQLLIEKGTKTGPVNKIKDDPRVTPVGKFIRRTSIDELPQFFNVLRGNMSVVGPRPHQPREVEQYDRHHKKVLTIKPGITGMGQVNGRSDLSFEDEVRYDTFYIENWSLWLDIIIILKTPLAIFSSRQAD